MEGTKKEKERSEGENGFIYVLVHHRNSHCEGATTCGLQHPPRFTLLSIYDEEPQYMQ